MKVGELNIWRRAFIREGIRLIVPLWALRFTAKCANSIFNYGTRIEGFLMSSLQKR